MLKAGSLLSEIRLVLCSMIDLKHPCRLAVMPPVCIIQIVFRVHLRLDGMSLSTMQKAFSGFFFNDTMQNEAAMLRFMSNLPSGLQTML